MPLPSVNIQPAPQAGGSFWGGTPAQIGQFGKFDQGGQNALAQLLQMGMQGAQKNSDFAPIAANARNQFETRTMPSLMERFGSLGGMRSGGYANMLERSRSDFETQLAALESQHNTSMMPYYNQMAQMGLTPQYETSYINRQPGALENIGSPLMALLGLLGAYYGMKKVDQWMTPAEKKAAEAQPGTTPATETGTVNPIQTGTTENNPGNGIANLRQLTGPTGMYGVNRSSGGSGVQNAIGTGLQYGGPIAGEILSNFFPGGSIIRGLGNLAGSAGSAMRA